jgi:Fe-S-cluster containining protein
VADRKYEEGKRLLRQPVMPLVAMVQFLFMTGPFAAVGEVIDEMPEPIETDRTTYTNPRALLKKYGDILVQYEQLKKGSFPSVEVVDEQGNTVDAFGAACSLIQQQILTRELERINSVLCGPCGCALCCVGPDSSMTQEFFEIPLADNELDLFAVTRYESEESLCRDACDDDELFWSGQPFYKIAAPGLFHWRNGWSLILPKDSRCPNLDAGTGACRVYSDRPQVCRRPQIFPYMLEPLASDQENGLSYRLRQALLAIVDCPYVRDLQNDIAEYAAASDLHLVLKKNKA